MIKSWQELVQATRKKCTDSPDVVYQADLCLYTEGECSDGSVGCLFGQILEGHNLYEYDQPGNYTAIDDVAIAILGKIPLVVCAWLSRIQIKQDIETPWGECLSSAEEEFGEEVNKLLEKP